MSQARANAFKRHGKAGRTVKSVVMGAPLIAGVSGLVIGSATPAFAGTTADRTDTITFTRFSTGTQITCSIHNHIENPPYKDDPELAFASMVVSGPEGCRGQITMSVSYTQPHGGSNRAFVQETGTKLQEEFAPVARDFVLQPSVLFVDCAQSATNNCNYSGLSLSNP